MSVGLRLGRLLRSSPSGAARKLSGFVRRALMEFDRRYRDRRASTFPLEAALPAGGIGRLIPALGKDAINPWRAALLYLSQETCAHRFDLLGSGPVVNRFGMRAEGIGGIRYQSAQPRPVNRSNRSEASRVARLITPEYERIDWHIDVRSGYRWREDCPSSQIRYGTVRGVDIKLPWELARMQHGSWLAFAYAEHLTDGDTMRAESMKLEFRNQVLDFISANPPRFGVNWVCTMDVAIRAVNWLVAFDLFLGFGAEFDQAFSRELERSVYAHGVHIVNNLEWFHELRSNHYLANMAGLLIIAAYSPATKQTDAWLAFAASQLCDEISCQFLADGSNFEASTSYHRLSAEMVLFGTSYAHSVKSRLDSAGVAKLADLGHVGPGVLPNGIEFSKGMNLTASDVSAALWRMRGFTLAVTRPDGRVAQIGDNDSGRFLKLSPDWRQSDDGRWFEEPTSHQSLLSGIDAACRGAHLTTQSVDALVVGKLIGRALLDPSEFKAEFSFDSGSPSARFRFFNDFGIYVYRRDRLWMSVRCGPVGQNLNGGHAHNDLLSIELCLKGVPFVVDPGTYTYTPFPDERNKFRSSLSHATLVAYPGEQHGWSAGGAGLFSLTKVSRHGVLECSAWHFKGEHYGFSHPHVRTIQIEDDGICVVDECGADNRTLVLTLAPDVTVETSSLGRSVNLACRAVAATFQVASGVIELVPGHFSPMYGVCERTNFLLVKNVDVRCQWQIRLRG